MFSSNNLVLNSVNDIKILTQLGGGKAGNLAFLTQNNFQVPPWFCISTICFDEFIRFNNLYNCIKPPDKNNIKSLEVFSKKIEDAFLKAELPKYILSAIEDGLKELKADDSFIAVRSSGLDEDSADNSFAGQFSSYLYQKGIDNIIKSLKQCWAGGFSTRVLKYRMERGLGFDNIKIGVIIQKMVNSEISGVMFTRNPVDVMDRKNILVSSVYGIGEGLVGGSLDSDDYFIDRENFSYKKNIAFKRVQFVCSEKGGVKQIEVEKEWRNSSSLSSEKIRELSQIAIDLENKSGYPQDCEWGIEDNTLYLLQTRPITNLPPADFYKEQILGDKVTLWDNSNIIESYNGVTSPLTFTFASRVYEKAYVQFVENAGVPKKIISANQALFSNMLGSIRGQVYYNLFNWYRYAVMLPGVSKNAEFMETMMGVKKSLGESADKEEFKLDQFIVSYSLFQRIKLTLKILKDFIFIDKKVRSFTNKFDKNFQLYKNKDFKKISLTEQIAMYFHLEKIFLEQWKPPLLNDYLCMMLFGILKKLTNKWVLSEGAELLQNDLLCGQGNIESVKPVKRLMSLARKIDTSLPEERDWLLNSNISNILQELDTIKKNTYFAKEFSAYLDLYGFRCVDELKLEEDDMYDNPSVIVNTVIDYIKSKSYDSSQMSKNEIKIREKAEQKVKEKIGLLKRILYFWILKHTRIAVKNRESLRFARTKVFGIARRLFKGIGYNFYRLKLISKPKDIFYLTIDEIISLIEGRSISSNIFKLAQMRKQEYEKYRKSPPCPDRMIIKGAVGFYDSYLQVLTKCDGLKDLSFSENSKKLVGIPCSPGVVSAKVKVVQNMKDAEGLNGEILVTFRTDPGWITLFPTCSGLLIERGSLLSHSAVVAREMGIPTIVSVGGLTRKLKTGMTVKMDGGRGIIEIVDT